MKRQLAVAALAALALLAQAKDAPAELVSDTELQHSLDRIRAEPRSADAFAALAAWLFRQGDLARARAAAEEAARLDPTVAAHQRLLGYVAAAAGDDVRAEAALRQAVSLDPGARSSLADFHLARAWAGYQEALRRDGPDPLLLQRLREIGAAAEITPELKALVRGGLPVEVDIAPVRVPPIYLGEGVATAIVVEKSTQTVRLYGRSGDGVVLLKTYPCTTGQASGAKQERGDLKTPDGVYFVHDLLPGEKLPDKYGALALPLNYPNAWDRAAGRSGHGIWFHGSDRLASPFTPRDTQGCVILRNEDLLELTAWIAPQATPILIAEEIPERPLVEWQAEVQALVRRSGSAMPAAIAVAPEYAVVLNRIGEVARYQFLPAAESADLLRDEATTTPTFEWHAKLAQVLPQDLAVLEAVALTADDHLELHLSAPIRARLFRPELGRRVYIDLPGVRAAPVPEQRRGRGIVDRVRITAAALEPPLTRLAIDLRSDATARLEATDDGFVVVFTRSQPPPAAGADGLGPADTRERLVAGHNQDLERTR